MTLWQPMALLTWDLCQIPQRTPFISHGFLVGRKMWAPQITWGVKLRLRVSGKLSPKGYNISINSLTLTISLNRYLRVNRGKNQEIKSLAVSQEMLWEMQVQILWVTPIMQKVPKMWLGKLCFLKQRLMETHKTWELRQVVATTCNILNWDHV